jgi:hypothetical protein
MPWSTILPPFIGLLGLVAAFEVGAKVIDRIGW